MSCESCPKVYIGETGRTARVRAKNRSRWRAMVIPSSQELLPMLGKDVQSIRNRTLCVKRSRHVENNIEKSAFKAFDNV